MDIRGYLQTSVNEWPGKLAAVVWVPGCNFRCPFCQNRDLVLNPQKLPQISEKKILADLKKRKKWIDAVVVTGGEPTLQEDLSGFLSRCKRVSFLTMIETNGTRPEIIAKLLDDQMIDRIAMDIKVLLDDKSYNKACGVKCDLKTIKKSIKLILNSGIDFEFRTTVVPTFHTKENLVKLARQLKGLYQRPKTKDQRPIWFLQQFVPQNCLDPAFEKIKPYSKKEMKEILLAVQKYLPEVKLRGV
jgi:pyruvate formate lyase activating enzyme